LDPADPKRCEFFCPLQQITVFITTEHYILFGANQAYLQKLMFMKIHFSVTKHRIKIVHNNPEVKFPITCHDGTQEE
jgi:hypothetical protein